MKIVDKKEFVGHILMDAEHARNLYHIHVKFSAGVIEAVSIVRNGENVLIFDRDNFGWQIKAADKQTETVYRETLKHLSLKPTKETAR